MTNTLEGSPFQAEVDPDDEHLCALAVQGDAHALETLISKHQPWIYNLALRLVLSPADAEDIAQDALIRIITRLHAYEGRAAFRSWAYRIVINRFLDTKRGALEKAITTFATYGDELDALPMAQLSLAPSRSPERDAIVEDARVGCMLGMLLCLSREQRVVYVLAEIFEAPSHVACELIGITPAAFRKRLERARRDLISFMNEKCGLLHQDNPCRCDRKTRAFIDAGWVDVDSRRFTRQRVRRLRALAKPHADALKSLEQADAYAALFRDHPMLDAPDLVERLRAVIDDPGVMRLFQLT